MNNILSRFQVALYFSLADLKAKHRRSVLGNFWIVLTTLLSVVGLSFVWSLITKTPSHEIVPNLCIGLITWQFIANQITSAPSLFVRNSNILQNIEPPISYLSLQSLFNALIVYFYNFLLIIFIMIIYLDFNFANLLFFTNLIIISFLIYHLNIILGFFGARYRDIEPLINSSMPILFFLTPVMYKVKSFGEYAWIQYFNPFYHLLSFIRDPLLGSIPNLVVTVTVISLSLAFYTTSSYLTKKFKGRIFFWL